MTIHKNLEGTKLTVEVEGRLDTSTAPQLESELKEAIPTITDLYFDFAKLEYISSAGLRVLLASYKSMSTKGSMVVANANENILEVFEVTGFSDMLTIQS